MIGGQGCRRAAVPTPEARVLAAVADSASGNAHDIRERAGRPLMIDVGSFARHGEAFGAPVSKRQVEASIRSPHRDARERKAIRCARALTRCRVRGDGLYVRMDSLTRAGGGGFSAFVTCVWPDRRLLGMVHLRFDVRRRGPGWLVSSPAVEWIT